MPKTTIPVVNGRKRCSKCKEWKLLDASAFRPHAQHQTGYRSQCRKCENVNRKPSVARPVSPEWKVKVLAHYGDKCACCGESTPQLLNVDHIHNNGHDHKGKGRNRYKGGVLYRYLVQNGYPDGIQILCFNCNIGRRNNGGVCPHVS